MLALTGVSTLNRSAVRVIHTSRCQISEIGDDCPEVTPNYILIRFIRLFCLFANLPIKAETCPNAGGPRFIADIRHVHSRVCVVRIAVRIAEAAAS